MQDNRIGLGFQSGNVDACGHGAVIHDGGQQVVLIIEWIAPVGDFAAVGFAAAVGIGIEGQGAMLRTPQGSSNRRCHNRGWRPSDRSYSNRRDLPSGPEYHPHRGPDRKRSGSCLEFVDME